MRGVLLAILALAGVLGLTSSVAQPSRSELHGSLPTSSTICITGLADGSLDIAVKPKGTP